MEISILKRINLDAVKNDEMRLIASLSCSKSTENIFYKPRDKRTEDYIIG